MKVITNTGSIIDSDDSDEQFSLGAIKVKRLNLSSAQLLALHTAPQIVVPAPGPNKLIIGHQAIYYVKFGSAAYLDPNLTEFYYKADGSGDNLVINASAGQFTQTADAISIAGGSFVNVNNAPHGAPVGMVNQPVVLFTPTANMTQGDGTATVWLFYIILDLTK